MVSPEDFSGKPFIAGSIFGERSWNVELHSGLLVSPSQPTFWESGENTAECSRPPRREYQWSQVIEAIDNYLPEDAVIESINHSSDFGGGGVYSTETYRYIIVNYTVAKDSTILNDRTVWGEAVRFEKGRWIIKDSWGLHDLIAKHGAPLEPIPHSLDGCSCGFYAYFNSSSNEYFSLSSVTGIIEGYGETNIGTKGFRCAKAKIVALYVPPKSKTSEKGLRKIVVSQTNVGFTDEQISMITKNYPDVEIFSNYDMMIHKHRASSLSDFSWDDVA